MSEREVRELWIEAGGGTDMFDAEHFKRLMIEEGHLIPRTEPRELGDDVLPCGWKP